MRARELVAAISRGVREHGAPEGMDAQVQWAQAVADADEAHGLLGGELAVAGDGAHRTARDAERLAQALAARGAVALAYVPSAPAVVPAELIAACGAHALPLVELAPGLDCDQLAETAVDVLLDAAGEGRAMRRRERALAAAADDASLLGVLEVLGRELEAPVWLATGGAQFAPPGQGPLDDADLRGLAARRAARDGAFELALASDRAASALPCPHADESPHGRAPELLVCGAPLATLRAPARRLALDQALRFLALQRAAAARERAARAAASVALLEQADGGGATGEELADRLRMLGVEPAGHVVGVVVQAPRAARRELAGVAAALEDVADVLATGRVVGVTEQRVGALLFAGALDEATDRALRQAPLLLGHELRRLDATLGSSAVIARQPSDVARALLEARQVARLNRLRGPDAEAASDRARDRSLAVMLLRRDPEAGATLHASVLGPLLAYDAEHGTELVRTLDVFLTHCGQWTASAHELGVHVNTLRYRLTRIEKVTRRDLRSMAARVDLFAALRAAQDD